MKKSELLIKLIEIITVFSGLFLAFSALHKAGARVFNSPIFLMQLSTLIFIVYFGCKIK